MSANNSVAQTAAVRNGNGTMAEAFLKAFNIPTQNNRIEQLQWELEVTWRNLKQAKADRMAALHRMERYRAEIEAERLAQAESIPFNGEPVYSSGGNADADDYGLEGR